MGYSQEEFGSSGILSLFFLQRKYGNSRGLIKRNRDKHIMDLSRNVEFIRRSPVITTKQQLKGENDGLNHQILGLPQAKPLVALVIHWLLASCQPSLPCCPPCGFFHFGFRYAESTMLISLKSVPINPSRLLLARRLLA